MVEKKTKTTTKTKTVVKKTAVKADKAHKTLKTEKTENSAKPTKKTAAHKFVSQIGKRKNATASVRLFEGGSGLITVNNLPFDQYFNTSYQKKAVEQVIKQTGIKDVDFTILVKGGGKTGQAEAIRLAMAKILIKINTELRPSLKAKGWLKRDPRVKERKKPGLKRARRAPQWSKR